MKHSSDYPRCSPSRPMPLKCSHLQGTANTGGNIEACRGRKGTMGAHLRGACLVQFPARLPGASWQEKPSPLSCWAEAPRSPAHHPLPLPAIPAPRAFLRWGHEHHQPLHKGGLGQTDRMSGGRAEKNQKEMKRKEKHRRPERKTETGKENNRQEAKTEERETERMV